MNVLLLVIQRALPFSCILMHESASFLSHNFDKDASRPLVLIRLYPNISLYMPVK